MDGNQPKEVSFNMAVATLARLDGILRRMEMISELTGGIREQRLQIKLLRHFFLNATPLLRLQVDDQTYDKYKERVYGIKILTKLIRGKRIQSYSYKLDDEILSIAMDIQTDIKEFFMPPRGEEDEDEI